MTKNEFLRATAVTPVLAERWYHPIMATMEAYKIDNPLRQSHFLAQIGTESGGLRYIEESFNYSVEGLRIFGSRLSDDQRRLLGRRYGEAPLTVIQQAEIANLVYGGRYGNIDDGDGWRYRGRGLKQITFRENYHSCGEALGLDLETNPELLLDNMNAACSAGWFWQVNNCNDIADRNDVRGLTRRINGGLNGLKERSIRTKLALRVLSPEHFKRIYEH